MTDKPPEDEIIIVSKSATKRESQAFQALAADLLTLSSVDLAAIPLDATQMKALEDSKRITQFSARKRQLQYLGKLIRQHQGEAILAAFEQLHVAKREAVRHLPQVEAWRDRLLNPDELAALTEFVSRYPEVDRQQLRQLIKQAIQEKAQNAQGQSARKLFQLIKVAVQTGIN